ncbi:MAG TPA: AI-2E family transporter [Burkholderiales bacterium]|nr:AI-2E family transporter [Burkholderiales bacterium]
MSVESDNNSSVPIPVPFHVTSWILVGVALIAVMSFHLVAALLAGLLVFQLVHMLSEAVRIPYLHSRYAKLLFVTLLAAIVITGLTLAGIGIGVFLRKGPDNLSTMMTQMAAIIDDLRRILPQAIVDYLPADATGVRTALAEWFRGNAALIRNLGTDTLRTFGYILIGLIVGAMVALHEVVPHPRAAPLARALSLRARRLAVSFGRILLAQVPISAVNTVLTAVYLVGVLPYLGIDLPFKKTLIALTFIAGLLPVVGNLISNTAIFLVSLSHSFLLAMASLGYLVVIHKLEYFLNARFVGNRINARPWEILIAMLFLEAAFGVSGLVMAPLVYAYVKYELMEQGLV